MYSACTQPKFCPTGCTPTVFTSILLGQPELYDFTVKAETGKREAEGNYLHSVPPGHAASAALGVKYFSFISSG